MLVMCHRIYFFTSSFCAPRSRAHCTTLVEDLARSPTWSFASHKFFLLTRITVANRTWTSWKEINHRIKIYRFSQTDRHTFFVHNFIFYMAFVLMENFILVHTLMYVYINIFPWNLRELIQMCVDIKNNFPLWV